MLRGQRGPQSLGLNWPSTRTPSALQDGSQTAPPSPVQPGPSVAPGRDCDPAVSVRNRTDTFLLSKEGQPTPPASALSQDQDGRYQAEFS